MTEFFRNLFQSDFMPHGHCYLWDGGILWTHVLSDAFIALAYYSIPLTLVMFVQKRRDLPFPWIFLMFGAFIIACGTTHLMEVWTVWKGTYRLSGVIKAMTAFLSVCTAIWLLRLVPVALKLPSPAELQALNRNLSREIAERQKVETQLRSVQYKLEQRVEERTAKLTEANAQLQAQMEERHRMTTALRESEQRFRLLVENVKDYAIIMLDPSGMVASWNSGAERITGYRSEEIMGRHISCFYPPENRQTSLPQEELDRARDDGHYELESRRMRKDGRIYWAAVTTSSVKDEAGSLVGFAKVIRDISRRREQEALIQASLREKEVLLQEIHHRVKNNMQVISSLLQLQSRQLSNPQALQSIQESQDRIRIMAMIHEKLYQSKSLARIDLQDYLRSLVSMLFRSYSKAGDRIRSQLDIIPVQLSLDTAIPLSLIIHELVSNSLKYAFAEGRTGTVRIQLAKEDEGRFVLVVADDGIGLAGDLDWEKSETLGMRLVSMLGRQLGGEAGFDSGTGGTKFTLHFEEQSEESGRNEQSE